MKTVVAEAKAVARIPPVRRPRIVAVQLKPRVIAVEVEHVRIAVTIGIYALRPSGSPSFEYSQD